MKLYLGIDGRGIPFRGVFTQPARWAQMTLRSLGCFYLLSLPRAGMKGLASGERLKPLFDGLGDLLQAGVPLAVALDSLSQEKSYGAYRLLIQEIKHYICHDGLSLGQALAKYPAIFEAHTVAFVTLAEHMGDYVHSCRFISHLFAKRMARDVVMGRIKRQLRVIAGFMLLMFVSLLIILVPQVGVFFQENNMTAGASTQLVMDLSDGVQNFSSGAYLSCLLGLVGIKALGVWIRDRLENRAWVVLFKAYVYQILLRLPLYRQYVRATLWFYMKCLVDRGVTFTDALKTCVQVFPNNGVKAHIHNLYLRMEKGTAITSALEGSFLCSHHAKEYIASLSSGNEIIRIIETIATLEQDRFTRNTERVQHMIYPTGILLIAGVILWIIYAVFFPIYHSVGIQL